MTRERFYIQGRIKGFENLPGNFCHESTLLSDHLNRYAAAFSRIRPRSHLVPVHGARELKWTLFRHAMQCPELKLCLKQLGKGINYREVGDKFAVGASTGREKVNSAGT